VVAEKTALAVEARNTVGKRFARRERERRGEKRRD
jgi:hypothetical protein